MAATSSIPSAQRFSERIRQFAYGQSNEAAATTTAVKNAINKKVAAATPTNNNNNTTTLKRSYSRLVRDSPLANDVSTSPSPDKKPRKISSTSSTSSTLRRGSSKYAPPSTYAHLPLLGDVLAPNLLIVFVGLNPGITTATFGHAYAHPSNWFWRLLHSSGLTPERRLDPTEDVDLPRLYSYGNTNIVSRPTRDQGELKRQEMVDGTAVLEAKVRAFRPEVVCLVGKGIWEAVWRWRHGKNLGKDEFRYGWQDESENLGVVRRPTLKKLLMPPLPPHNKEEKGETLEGEEGEDETDDWQGARVFVATSTSGQAANLRPKEKEEIWRPLGEWSQKRRAERDREERMEKCR